MTYETNGGQCARAFCGAKSVGIAAPAFGVIAAGFGMVTPTAASAHATGQSFVALLPTGPYMAIGVATSRSASCCCSCRRGPPRRCCRAAGRAGSRHRLRRAAGSLAVFLLLCGGIGAGLAGTRDPLENPLVLGFWVTFWMASPMMQGYLFDLWGWISPWRWAVHPMTGLIHQPPLHLPRRAGSWPAVMLLLCFSAFTLADPAPDDPARLAKVMAGYAVVTFAGMALVGPRRWLRGRWNSCRS